MKHPIKAIRSVHGVNTYYRELDCKILNKIAKLIIKHGAISYERLKALNCLINAYLNWAVMNQLAKG